MIHGEIDRQAGRQADILTHKQIDSWSLTDRRIKAEADRGRDTERYIGR